MTPLRGLWPGALRGLGVVLPVKPLVPKVPLVMPLMLTVLEPTVRGLRPVLVALRGLWPLSVASPSLWPLSAMTTLRGLWPGAVRGPWAVLPMKTTHRRPLPYEAALSAPSCKTPGCCWRGVSKNVLPPLPPPLVPPAAMRSGLA